MKHALHMLYIFFFFPRTLLSSLELLRTYFQGQYVFAINIFMV